MYLSDWRSYFFPPTLHLCCCPSSPPSLQCLFVLFNRQTNLRRHVSIAHRRRFCQEPQKATFNLALLPVTVTAPESITLATSYD